jgi:hypothetical protein
MGILAMTARDQNMDRYDFELANMPGFEKALERVYAWYENEIIDRAPIRFMAHNAFLETETETLNKMTAEQRKNWWFNTELQIDNFLKSIEGKTFRAETFPVYFPNLGPDVYAGFYGAELEFGAVTSWSIPLVHDWEDMEKLVFYPENIYFKKIEELTNHALERCDGNFMVGYTDLHPGLDCAAAWRDPQQLCFDMIDYPDQVQQLLDFAIADFERIYDHFDSMLKVAGQLSVSWMGIPSFGRMHIPSCDFSNMISPHLFRQFGLSVLEQEVKSMTHNIFHVDGKGVAKHLDMILNVPEVHAIQWVQGVGDDLPIIQWVPFIKTVQAQKVPIIVDLNKDELTEFISVMDPTGLFLWVATENEQEEIEILKILEKWS